MKKIINDPQSLVADMLRGYALAFPQRIRLVEGNLIARAVSKASGKVGLVIGNGSGHEPAMIDLVGEGLFDVNVAGRIFTAPPPHEMLAAIRLADRGAGVLVLVSSHQGDILNARMALMMAEAEGLTARMVILYDDVSSAPKGRENDRRGTAGLFFCWKIVGAAAEAGLDLETCARLAEEVRDATRTLSVAVSAGTHPETGHATFDLPPDEVEVGMGVHGEAGSGRMKLPTARALTDTMLNQIIPDLPFVQGDEVLVLVNGMGATTRMELMTVYAEVHQALVARGIAVARAWVGTYVTTQEMGGIAISLMKTNPQLTAWYDAPADSVLFDGR